MKNPTLLTLGLALAASCSAAFAGPTLDRVTQKGELTGVLMESYPPFSFLNDQNQLDGFDVDVAKAVTERLGVKLKLETPSWDVIAAGHWNGRYDICVCSMTPSKVRAEVFDFPVEYYQSPAVIVVNAKDEDIVTGKDLSGKKVGVISASTYEAYLNKDLVIEGGEDRPLSYPFDSVQIAPYDNETVAFQDLALGTGVRLDAMVTNLITARERIAQDPRFKIAGDSLYSEPNVVAVEKGDPQWNAKVTEVIAQLKTDGTLGKISRKWIGSDISQ
ncbi:amino acid ABC transporter substrate-binding protein [Pseudomonas sp. FW215-R2]|uniref:transporter substrate-binding domain-containing protein n=1 Tax=unclassified Pseudomonas TaxID=196821 RepID=UPI000C8886D7|nr:MULTISPECIES: transporter substrate-binding domain-containing protein [unclassified Pseudomonas]PMX03079.1 amino acid ABC transporter substrate-binding protein [Pseudomonas sp. FW215-R2]PMX11956.1 amino acid ABC transporter substrate-binding protein [Pseudomonas sp. FW215-L1]PMX25626.1 amino acid ABC transporter substrate-binding protein [Pseudomonas sp. FW215-E1]PNA32628.1 amino acid ABC transporter substrate-binding protein [Pseudomonas sp. FW215-R4]